MNYAHSLVGGAPNPELETANMEMIAKEIIPSKESATLSHALQIPIQVSTHSNVSQLCKNQEKQDRDRVQFLKHFCLNTMAVLCFGKGIFQKIRTHICAVGFVHFTWEKKVFLPLALSLVGQN